MGFFWVLVSKVLFSLLPKRALGGCLYLGLVVVIALVAVIALVVGLVWYELSEF